MRELFDLDSTIIYLNSGTHSICPRRVREAVTRYQLDYEKNPSRSLVEVWGKLWSVQKSLGRFLKADPKDLILRPNVTALLNEMIQGVPLEPGAELLVTDLEYGAIVNICRFVAERIGGTLRVATLPFGGDPVEALVRQLSPQTRLLLVSHVMTSNGLKIDLERLSRETRKRGIYLVVDGAHAAGALDLDFSALPEVDFYAGNLHKWVMAPKGTAFGWVAKRHQEKLRPLQAGWATFEACAPYSQFGEGADFPRRFLLQGCLDFSSFLGIQEALDFWDEVGAAKIREQLQSLQGAAQSLAQEILKWPLLSPAVPSERGPLVSFALPEPWQQKSLEPVTLWARVLEKTGVQVAVTRVQGRLALRLSPHVFNTESEIKTALKRLKEYFEQVDPENDHSASSEC
jgi:isopenicillin-N epimerase